MIGMITWSQPGTVVLASEQSAVGARRVLRVPGWSPPCLCGGGALHHGQPPAALLGSEVELLVKAGHALWDPARKEGGRVREKFEEGGREAMWAAWWH